MSENAIVEQAAREHLNTLLDGEVMSTRQLTEALARSNIDRGSERSEALADLPPHRVATVLCRLARYQLSDCADQGEPTIGRGFNRGKMIRPWHSVALDKAAPRGYRRTGTRRTAKRDNRSHGPDETRHRRFDKVEYLTKGRMTTCLANKSSYRPGLEPY
jgi:hypothetical protein